MNELVVGMEEVEVSEEQVEKADKKRTIGAEDKVTLRDVGNGLILLAGLLLIGYFALLFVTVLVQVEPGQGVWTMPSYMVSTVVIALILIIVGLTIRKICIKKEKA